MAHSSSAEALNWWSNFTDIVGAPLLAAVVYVNKWQLNGHFFYQFLSIP
jgi:hypothetical protein